MNTRIFTNGTIYTPIDPYATALLTQNGTTRWAGSDAGAHSIADPTMETINLNGRLITPTFTRTFTSLTHHTTPEIHTYLTTHHANGYHTHTLTTTEQNLPTLLQATTQLTQTHHTTPDIRLYLTPHPNTQPNPAHIQHHLKNTPITLTGIHTPNPHSDTINHLATIVTNHNLTLSINAQNLTTAYNTALTTRKNHPHLNIRLDYTPHHITNAQLQNLTQKRIHIGLQTTQHTADTARRANTVGTSIALGSDPTPNTPNGWQLIKTLTTNPNGISARSAFAALTRGPHRLNNDTNPFNGQLATDTPANLAVWNITELMVQAPDSRIASWSTDPRARIPLLPVLEDDVPLPTLERIYTAAQ